MKETNNCSRVIVSVADVRGEPVFASERLDQRLFNQFVTTGQRINNYVRVSWPTGDGWMKQSYLEPCGGPEAYQYVVDTVSIRVYEHDRVTLQNRLSFNTRLNINIEENGWCEIKSPYGKTGWLQKSKLRKVSDITYAADEVIQKVRSFLGLPYVWGGLSGFGLDCSGLVTIMASYYGYEYRHKTGKMVEFGEEIGLQELMPLDLLFFPDHVAIYLGNNEIIHANTRAGGLNIDSINPENSNYNPVIEKLMVAKRMPLK